MEDLSKKAADTVALITGTLIIGNHDSISLFGIHAQNNLKDYSKKVATLLLKNTEEIDTVSSEITAEIERFENAINAPSKSFLGKARYNQNLPNEFRGINTYIENTTTYFKLQKAYLIKEIKLLEKLAETVKSCSSELNDCIEIGKKYLQNRSVGESTGFSASTLLQDDPDNELWYSRLRKRVDDLSISHVLSLQSQTQIKMLHDSDLILLDRISNTIANVFPVWQNQMAIMLGISLTEKRMNASNRVLDLTGKIMKAATKPEKRKISYHENALFYSESIQKTNNLLREALSEMTSLEENDATIRQDIQNALLHTERGHDDE